MFLLAFTACASSFSATESDWMEISDDKDTTVSVNVVDLKNQKIKNINSVGAWVKSVYKTPQVNEGFGEGKPIAKFLSMHWYQCKIRSVSDPIEITFYGADGNFIDSYSEETKNISFRHVTPDTIESNIQTAVCMSDLANQMEKIRDSGSVSDYDYRRLKSEYPYEFKLLDK